MIIYQPSYEPQVTKLELDFGVPLGSPDIRQCIYCGSMESLTDEHTIPYGLYGRNKLLNGSCHSCNKPISNFERQVLQDNLGTFREAMSIRSRRQKQKGTRKGTQIFTNDEGTEVEAPLYAGIVPLLMPSMNYLPRGLTNEVRGKRHRTHNAEFFNLPERSDPVLSGFWGEPIKFDYSSFQKLLLKIALSEYIRRYDQSYRVPAISNLLLHGKGDATRYIGGRSGAPKTNRLHIVEFCTLKNSDRKRAPYSLVSYIRLFSYIDTPSYLIWLGEGDESLYGGRNLNLKTSWNKDTVWIRYPA